MIKSLVIFIIFVFYSNFSKAEPMWEIAENWVCNKTYSLMGRVDGEYDPWREQMYQDNPFDLTYKDIYLNKHEPYVIFYDFKKEVTIGSDGHPAQTEIKLPKYLKYLE